MNTDIRINSYFARRDEFFKGLKKVFYDLNGENLPIYGVVIFCAS